MRYIALATDYDGTLAEKGKVSSHTIASLKQLRESGRRAILISGRELDDLRHVFDSFELFDRVVVENGALLYRPDTREEVPLADPPPPSFIARLQKAGVPFSVGRAIVATHEPHETNVLEIVKELGLEMQVIFNKGAVMVLPSGTNKASGLAVALAELKLSCHNVVAIGDAENDHALLNACEFSVAVANALPMLKEHADVVTRGERGDGVAEIITQLIEDDLLRYERRVVRRSVLVGHVNVPANGSAGEVTLIPNRGSALVAGPSGSGKSSLVSGLLERMAQREYQFCLVDPEGDYDDFPEAVVVGGVDGVPSPDNVLKALSQTKSNVIVNLLSVPLEDRPRFFTGILGRILELRASTARPHWLVIDEAHHLLPSAWVPAHTTVPQALSGTLLITVHPEQVAVSALREVNTLIAVGHNPAATLSAFARRIGRDVPHFQQHSPSPDTAVVWNLADSTGVQVVSTIPANWERRRHVRKYAEGQLPEDRSFYFRGSEGRLNLRAHNTQIFLQIAEGVDDETWLYHLRNGDYSKWVREAIKDADLANEVAGVERESGLPPSDSRSQIRAAIERRYTAGSVV